MNPLLRLIQRFRRIDTDELRSRQRTGEDARSGRRELFGKLHNLLRRRREGGTIARPGGAPRFNYSYTVFWLNIARTWDAARRRQIAAALDRALSAPDFVPTVTEARFTVPGLDRPYSGASLVALRQVLRGLAEEKG